MSSDRDSRDSKKNESVFTRKFRAGKRRTYFFDVRQTKSEDYFLMLTESSRRQDGSYDRQKIVLFKEDLTRFAGMLEETLHFIKNDLLPDYDFEEFERKNVESDDEIVENAPEPEKIERQEIEFKIAPKPVEPRKNVFDELDEEDMSW